ncbi:winged helix-turn-helix transcriptional regulator [Defluviitoga tunisiensis]|uniref:MarR family transcriptional regulator n=1 Tax=Defluviitoga tunisiensis TaxID=1006576 RepID=A0A0C7NK98_DEFTU|nr:winged helix-turn-helix transcriptional regulator [Defluviitoga tunisiensis]CEP78301.1 MarR family transcriptional regulator [Defluviitoga tunisiensis]
MEENELLILEIIENNASVTQREISKKSGLSLGMVNLLLKKFVKKGLVKLERLDGKSFRYILTPEGFKEKSKKTIDYIKRYYNKTMIIKQNIERVIRTYGRNRTYALFGNDKEMKEIIEGILKELNVDYIIENNLQNINNSQIIIFWDIDDKEKLNEFNCEFLLGNYNNEW